MLGSIFLDFWKDKFPVYILCLISLLVLCLEVEIIKMLLWPLNEQAATFKNGKKQQKWHSTCVFNSHYNFRARKKFIK